MSILETTMGIKEEYLMRLLMVALILAGTKVILRLIRNFLLKRNNMDKGSAYALTKIISYVFWIAAIAWSLETVGIRLNVFLAGSAALLVGVGLGLQQIFNDFISGIILLTEKNIVVGDILEIDGDIVKIEHIGLRTSGGLNRDEISVIIPNSVITSNKVINWSHQSKMTRFRINIGVAYGSDVQAVTEALRLSVHGHADVIEPDNVDVRLIEFGQSSLDFQILFYSRNIFRIEKVKSDIRKQIEKNLRDRNITIPFPQMDVYVKSQV